MMDMLQCYAICEIAVGNQPVYFDFRHNPDLNALPAPGIPNRIAFHSAQLVLFNQSHPIADWFKPEGSSSSLWTN